MCVKRDDWGKGEGCILNIVATFLPQPFIKHFFGLNGHYNGVHIGK